MKKMYQISYILSDRDIDFPEKTEELEMPEGTLMSEELSVKILRNHLNKYKYAQDLSNDFTFKITDASFCGWCK